MANDFYSDSNVPSTGAALVSATIRAEFDLVAAGFDKMPALTGNGAKAVVVNAGGTALGVTTGTFALAGNFATTGAFNTTLIQGASVSLTLPLVSGTLATLAGTETLTNKTIGAATLSGTISGGGQQLNNIIIGTSTPLAGSFTTLAASGNFNSGGNVVGVTFITTANGGVSVSPAAATGQFGGATVGGGVITGSGSTYDVSLRNKNDVVVGGVLTGTTNLSFTGAVTAWSGTAAPAGGTLGTGLMISNSSNFGTFFGSGAPTLAAAQGSIYLRTDGTTTNNRLYVNTNGNTTWTAVTTAA